MTMCSRAPRLARGCALPNNHSAVYVTRPAQTQPAGYAIAQPTPRGSISGHAHLDERQHRAPVPGGGGRPEGALEVGVVELGAAIAVRQVQIDDAPGTRRA